MCHQTDRTQSTLIRGSTDFVQPPSETELPVSSDENDPFYSVPFVQPLAELENCLSECDPLDFSIMALILDGRSYEDIAEELFISEGSLKYRLNKLYTALNVRGKSEFVLLVRNLLGSANPFAEHLEK